MGRAERRRLEKQKGKQVKTYNLTRSQLHNAVRQVTEEDLKRIKQEAMEDAINTAMTLLLVLPMEVLMDHYWKKTYAKKIPEFTELVLQYYERWQNGELDEKGSLGVWRSEIRRKRGRVIMAIRNMLHISQLKAFKDFLESKGYMIIPTAGEYEVLRAQKPKKERKPKESPVIVYKRKDAKEHLSIMKKDFYLVNEFLRTKEAE